MMRDIGMLLLLTACFLPAPAGASSAGSLADAPAHKRNTTAAPVVRERYDYYEVCGCCEKELQCDLEKKCVGSSGGKKYDSLTDWKLKWDYGRRSGPALCTADAFTVTVDITFHLPKWVNSDKAAPALVERWEKYSANLLAHEKEHARIAIEAAQGFTQAVGDLSSSRSCAELDESVQLLAAAWMQRLCDDQKAYDTATDHGAAQGARFP